MSGKSDSFFFTSSYTDPILQAIQRSHFEAEKKNSLFFEEVKIRLHFFGEKKNGSHFIDLI